MQITLPIDRSGLRQFFSACAEITDVYPGSGMLGVHVVARSDAVHADFFPDSTSRSTGNRRSLMPVAANSALPSVPRRVRRPSLAPPAPLSRLGCPARPRNWSGVTCTVQFRGSMGACARNGSS
jgi:hypothetical protein